MNSCEDTSAEANPPNPLNRATICGIAVILTSLAIEIPIVEPIISPIIIQEIFSVELSKIVTKIAINIAEEEIRFPDLAVLGELSFFIPITNNTEEII